MYRLELSIDKAEFRAILRTIVTYFHTNRKELPGAGIWFLLCILTQKMRIFQINGHEYTHVLSEKEA